MRIVSGRFRGRALATPPGLATRPTSDRARQALFNVLEHAGWSPGLGGRRVLDLFAGSGAMGLEALSRGAASAVFVESDRDACRVINANLDKLRLTGARVLCSDVHAALAAEAVAGRRYDLVLVDPPYEMFASLQPALAAYLPTVLAEDGLLVVETGAKQEPELPLAKRTSRRYGAARLTLFEQP